tara:strand:- start:24208 stop:24561 length:354 start_codon:yes stop_codon:yes gene_type:complete
MQKSNKIKFYIILAAISLSAVLLFMKPLDEHIEKLYELNLKFYLIFPFIAFFIKYRLPFLIDNKWQPYLLSLFVISFFSGLGLLVKYAFFNRISFLGVDIILFSTFFLIISINFHRK